ncbi:MAG TPA: hypothetical protein VGC37_00975 [Friedmanniella sp.]
MAALGTQTLTEVADLALDAVHLLRRHGAALVGWFCLGWATHEIGLFGSALLGVRHAFLANLVFVLAVVAELVALVLMVNVVRPGPTAAADLVDGGTGAGSASLPSELLAPERTLDVVTLAVGPFLAVYAVWGFLDDEVSALFRSNYIVQGLGGVQDWSIGLNPARLPIYLGLAAGGFLLRAAVRLVLRRRRSQAVAVVGLVAEGVWALSVFVVLVVVVRVVKGWLQERLVWAELAGAAQAVLSWLPAITLPFGPTLREAVRILATQAPSVLLTVVGLPLMWLALTAVVYGWREVTVADALGARVAGRLGRWSRHADTPVGRVLLLATDDLRTKYLPVVSALRVVGRAGPRLIGAYLLLATALQALDRLLEIGVSVLAGPQPVARTLLLGPVEDLAVSALVTMASVALYGAVFARALTPRPARSRRSGSERERGPVDDL